MTVHPSSLQVDTHLDIYHAIAAVRSSQKLALSENAKSRIQKCKTYLDETLRSAEKPIYGIDTGFGSLCNVRIDKDSLSELQVNLVRSHACGMGGEVPPDVVGLMLLFKIQGLSQGHSGVKMSTVDLLVSFFDHGILPIVRELGSLGASGDLAPLAHLSLPLLGDGQVTYQGKRMKAMQALSEAGLQAIGLEAKEGLALLNGTQFMSAYGVHIAVRFKELLELSMSIMAMSIDAFDGRPEAFDLDLHRLRPHPGQAIVSEKIQSALKDSRLIGREKEHVQDPYSFRCIPQVVGASWDVMEECLGLFQREVNSVTDNPTIFPDEGKIISGGNFHGQPLAMGLDRLAIAMAEVGSISERRTYKLIDGQRGLPAYLVSEPGLNSGFMIIQYSAASIVSQNKQLASPSSIDSIDSSQGQEDHVSMGANAATKAHRILENLERILAVELLTAAQALDFQGVEESSPKLQQLHASFRTKVPFMAKDVISYDLMDDAVAFVKNWTIY